jgi:mannose-6-phosphate isomerase-like protein (cupin superfamily)
VLVESRPVTDRYAIVDLTAVEDYAPKFGYAELQEARFPWRDLGAEATGLAFYRLKPGRRQPFAHRHERAEEIYVVLAGSGRIKLDDEVQDIRSLQAIRVAPAVARAFEAGSDGLELLAFGTHHEQDGELIHEGFWDD